jgi:ABC-2 type transport system ATP-binding protein
VDGFRVSERRRIRDLSRGERAKVALSLAMAHRPELLVLDEPTNGLDPLVRREFLEAMTDVATSGRTVLLSSHQIQEVERVADALAILRGGRLAAAGPVDELKRQVREVTVTLRNASSTPPDLGGSVLYSERYGRAWRLLVRDVDDALLVGVRSDARVRQLHVRRPGLEEIYAALVGG